MKKKGILLLGSLTLMVVAMVFITVTLVTRANVSPEPSDAASLNKKKAVSISSVSSSSKTSVKGMYTFLPYQLSNNVFNNFARGLNNNGYSVGSMVSQNSYPTPAIWDPKGNQVYLPNIGAGVYRFSGINDSNVIIAKSEDYYAGKVTAVKYSTSTGMINLKGLNNTILPKPIMRPINNFNKTNEPNFILSEDTQPTYINKDGDIVGFSNKKAVLWLNEKTDPINISTYLRMKEPNIYSEANYISDRKDGVVTIVGRIIDSTVQFLPQYKMYLLQYSVTTQKIISYTLQEDINKEKLQLIEPKKILSDGSIATNYVTQSEKGTYRWDAYIFKNAKFTEYIMLKDILGKVGITSSTFWMVDINDSTILGYYGLDDDLGNIRYFIANFKTNKVDFVDDLITSGQIIGYENTSLKWFHPDFINSSGEIIVTVEDYTNPQPLRYPAKLSPINQ